MSGENKAWELLAGSYSSLPSTFVKHLEVTRHSTVTGDTENTISFPINNSDWSSQHSGLGTPLNVGMCPGPSSPCEGSDSVCRGPHDFSS